MKYTKSTEYDVKEIIPDRFLNELNISSELIVDKRVIGLNEHQSSMKPCAIYWKGTQIRLKNKNVYSNIGAAKTAFTSHIKYRIFNEPALKHYTKQAYDTLFKINGSLYLSECYYAFIVNKWIEEGKLIFKELDNS